MCKNIFIYFLATIVMTSAQVHCPNEAICLPIPNCPGLYNGLKDLFQKSQISVSSLFRRLHCGFDNNTEKICCPPEFQESNGMDLLPNTTVCGIQYSNRIYGGVETDIDEHPWIVLIGYRKLRGINFNCGGVLISSRYVMTAAHCVRGNKIPQNAILFWVRLGEWKLTSRIDCQGDDCSPDPLNVAVENIIPHENYNPTSSQNDIALVRLVRDVPFTDFVRPICLPIEPTLRRNSFENYDMETAGWGKTEIDAVSDVKLKVHLRVTNTEDCRVIYEHQNHNITEQQLCAGGIEGQDSCIGDSGGALMGPVGTNKNWIAIGITSFGPSPCGSAGWPGIYTRVTQYIDWILSRIRP